MKVEVPVEVTHEVEVEVPPKGIEWVAALQQLVEQIDRGLIYDRDLPAVAVAMVAVTDAVGRRPGLRTRPRPW